MTQTDASPLADQSIVLRVASHELRIVALRGVEELSKPFRFDLTAVAPDGLSASDVLGAGATFTLVGARKHVRVVRGVVASVRVLDHAGHTAMRVRVVPRLALLDHGRRSRVFQDLPATDILRAVLADAGVDCELKTSRAYAPRTYAVQYQESDLAFVSRIAAEEGLFFFVRQPTDAAADGKEVVVFADSAAHYEPLAGSSRVPLRAPGALAQEEQIESFGVEDRLRAGASLVRAYDFTRPKFDLRGAARATHTGSAEGAESHLTSYRHDADALEGVDDGVAARVLESERRAAARGEGASTCVAFTPGATFEVAGHPVEALNASFALVRVEHQAGPKISRRRASDDDARGDRYINRFTCVPAKTPFRPRIPVRPLQQTTETAVVVGPPGEEIHVDGQGRVKVQFPWDLEGQNDDKSSCWIRTMQPWAGPSWGFQFIPRVGMEVVVMFVGGDVDRPMIAGTVANGVNPFPYALPANKTQSGIRTRSSPGGAGSNELRFEDAAGQEQVYLHAQRDLDAIVGHDHTRTVHNAETISVAADRSVTIGGSQKRSVASDDELHVGQNRSMEIEGDHVRVVNGSEVVEIGKHLFIHVKGKQTIQVDGEDGEANTSADMNAAKAPEDPTKGLAGATPPPTPEAIDTAALKFAVEQLGDDAYETGKALFDLLESASPAVGALEQEAHSLVLLLRPTGVKLAPSLARSAESLLDRTKATRQSIVVASDLVEGESPELADVRAAFAKAAAPLVGRLDQVEAIGKGTLGVAREVVARGWTGEGGGEGGGGATPTWTQPKGEKGSSLKITGGGVIDSPDGLTLKCGGSSIILSDSQITLFSQNIVLHDGTVTVAAGAVKIVSRGIVSVEGAPISLN